MAPGSFTITPSGPFSLAEAAAFGFGQRDAQEWDGVLRLAFCVDGYQRQAGVEVRQDRAHGDVHCSVRGPADSADGADGGRDQAGVRQPVDSVDDADGADGAGSAGSVRDQVARVLSLDYDGAQFQLVGKRDPVIGRLQAAAPGLRPPLFYSPYEAAAWSVLSSRRPAAQMARVRERLSEAHGAVFDLAGARHAAFPTPAQLLGVGSFPGIPDDRMRRLHGVAHAAAEGRLDVARLKQLGPERAMAELRSIEGIGPFYSALIVIRGTGFADVLPVSEPRALALTARLYDLAGPPAEAEFRALAEAWRPFRTWAVVLIRAAARRVLDDPASPQVPPAHPA